MKNIEPEVIEAIRSFVSKEQSFISLDIYCTLGVRINDDEYPIHQQVRDAFVNGLITNYLSEWTKLSLESGGYANVWRYYLPKANVKEYSLSKRRDGRVEIGKEALGHFPLIDSDIGITIIDGKMLEISLDISNSEQIISNIDRVILGVNILRKANLLEKENLIAKVYPNRIKIMEKESC